MNALELKNISFGYDIRHKILDGVNLILPEGSVTAIKGKSGCGKSTLAMIACGIIPKAVPGKITGEVLVFGEEIAQKEIYETADKISMVFQDPESQLFAPTVADEVAFAPENLCFEEDIINHIVRYVLKMVGMYDFSEYSPNNLSGGQQQLIALASILSLDPKIIILDEVTSQIDTEGVCLIKKVLKELKMQGKTVLIIEHGEIFEMFYDQEYILQDGKLYTVVDRICMK